MNTSTKNEVNCDHAAKFGAIQNTLQNKIQAYYGQSQTSRPRIRGREHEKRQTH